MQEFLDVADDLRHSEKTGEMAKDFDLVFKAIYALRPAYANANVDLSNNIESVFAAFEMAKLINQLGNLSPSEVSRLPHAMRRVIELTLEKTIKLPVRDSRVRPPVPYDAFSLLLKDIRGQNSGVNSASVITFNYDLCLDYGLHFNNMGTNYCLDADKHSGLKLLKLHGSLNWAKC